MTEEAYLASVEKDTEPPDDLSPELLALWLTHHDRWDAAHDIAQDIDTPLGSWIHAHLHLIEGDISNAGYWYRRAGKPAQTVENRDNEWRTIVAAALAAQGQ